MPLCCCGNSADDTIIAKKDTHLRNLEGQGLRRCRAPRLRAEEEAIPVMLNVYSLVEKNTKLAKIGLGVFHTGVVVCGIEWSYGEVLENPETSGLFCVHPGQAAGNLFKTIQLGYTTKSPAQIDTILHRLENEWRSSQYHILHHNCNHFSQAFCDLLSTVEKLEVPAWCNRIARAGDRIIPRRLATKVQRMCDEEPPKAQVPPPKTNIGELPTSVIPRGWYLHPSVAQPPRYVHVFSDDDEEGERENSATTSLTRISTHFTSLFDNDESPPPPGYTAAESANLVVEVAANLPPDSPTSPLSASSQHHPQATDDSSSSEPAASVFPSTTNTHDTGEVGTRQAHYLQHHQDAMSTSASVLVASHGVVGLLPLAPTEMGPHVDRDEFGSPLPMSATEVEAPTTENSATERSRRRGKSTLLWRRKGKKEKKDPLHSDNGEHAWPSSNAASEPLSSPSDAALSFTGSMSGMSRAPSAAHVAAHAAAATEPSNGHGRSHHAAGASSGTDTPASQAVSEAGTESSPPPAALQANLAAGPKKGEKVEKETSSAEDSQAVSEAAAPTGTPPSGALLCHPMDETALPGPDNDDADSDREPPSHPSHGESEGGVDDENPSDPEDDEPGATPVKARGRNPSIATAAPTPIATVDADTAKAEEARNVRSDVAAAVVLDMDAAEGMQDLVKPPPVLQDSAKEGPKAPSSLSVSPTMLALPLPVAPVARPVVGAGRRSPQPQSVSPLSQSLHSVSETRVLPCSTDGGAAKQPLGDGSGASARQSPVASPLEAAAPQQRNVSLSSSGSLPDGKGPVQASPKVDHVRALQEEVSLIACDELSLLGETHGEAPLPAEGQQPRGRRQNGTLSAWGEGLPDIPAKQPALHLDPSLNFQDSCRSDDILGRVPSSALRREDTMRLPAPPKGEIATPNNNNNGGGGEDSIL